MRQGPKLVRGICRHRRLRQIAAIAGNPSGGGPFAAKAQAGNTECSPRNGIILFNSQFGFVTATF
jgi:hypothetical protein